MFSDRNHTCCFTGHRIIEERHLLLLPGLLEAALRELIADGYYTFAAAGRSDSTPSPPRRCFPSNGNFPICV